MRPRSGKLTRRLILAGTLSPAFDANTTSYTVTVAAHGDVIDEIAVTVGLTSKLARVLGIAVRGAAIPGDEIYHRR